MKLSEFLDGFPDLNDSMDKDAADLDVVIVYNDSDDGETEIEVEGIEIDWSEKKIKIS